MRRVIELGTPHLVAHWPQRIRSVVLATGEAPPPAWLKSFREQFPGTSVKVFHRPAFGYVSELASGVKIIERDVKQGVLELLPEVLTNGGLIWAHNLGLGRNLYLTRELTFMCHCAAIPLIVHHHDWWFENRWHHYEALRESGFRKLDAIAGAVLANSPFICHAAINQADAAVLEKHLPGRSGWLPNLAEPAVRPAPACVAAARQWLELQLGEPAPVWLVPCRLLRRKNIAEALLLTRWLRPEAWLVTTGSTSSSEELPYATALEAAAQQHGWRLRLGILNGEEGQKPSVPHLLAASETILLTSLQEGFGLPYLEAAAARRPLLARSLPNIAPDLAKFGFKFPQSYREVMVDPSLFDWRGERQRQVRLFVDWRGAMPRAAAQILGKPEILGSSPLPHPVPFSRLTLTAQLEILAQPSELSWERCVPLNPFLKTWRTRAAAGGLEVSEWPRSAKRWLGGEAYARRCLELVPPLFAGKLPASASKDAQNDFFRKKLHVKNLYPLLWSSRT